MSAALRSSFSTISRVARSAGASRQATYAARPASFRLQPSLVRGYAASAGLSKEAIETRVLDVLKSFEKVKADKVRLSSSLFLIREYGKLTGRRVCECS